MREELIALGIDNNKMVTWTRGGNHGAFKNPVKQNLPYKRPIWIYVGSCLLYTSPSPRDATLSRMPSSA